MLFKKKKIVLVPIKGDSEIESSETPSKILENQEEALPPSFLFLRLPLFQWRSFLLFTGISLGLIIHWFYTSELFDIPSDVAGSQQCFTKAKEGYFVNSSYWDAKQQHFIEYIRQELQQSDERQLLQRLQETPGEILISFLIQRLPNGKQRLNKLFIFPQEGSPCSVIISKYEPGIWPLKIMLSLELEIKIEARKLALSILRLRRGSQDLALGLSWAYFGPELDSIRQLASLSEQSTIPLFSFDPIK